MMEPTPTAQQRPPEKQKTTTTNTLLNLLTRRSTKVEPSRSIDSNNLNTTSVAAATSAHSSPISTLNQFRQGHLRRHSSTQNLSSIRRDESVSPLRNVKRSAVGGIPKKAKSSSSTNRFSHQFTLCCSVHDDRMCTPPVSVRYNSLAQVDLRKTLEKPADMNSITQIETVLRNEVTKPENAALKSNGHLPLLGSSNSFTTVTVHSNTHPESNIPVPTSSTSLDLPQTTTDDSSNDEPTDKPVVFNEYQSSIAMSACRSRLRERLLPPSGQLARSLDLPNSPSSTATDQHFSSPNICTIPSNGSSPARDKPTAISALVTNRSLSYDVLTGVRRPASADSLAKQSLIAAQLLNLIPTERARERYVPRILTLIIF